MSERYVAAIDQGTASSRCLGAAYPAGLARILADKAALKDNWHTAAEWRPQMDADRRARLPQVAGPDDAPARRGRRVRQRQCAAMCGFTTMGREAV